jgi:hypothetical protein
MGETSPKILWRYLDLAKYAALLQTRALHFTRGDDFEDPFEGSYPVINLKDFRCDEGGYSAKGWRKHIAISCWHQSDFESDAMWRLYTNRNQGVAIKTTWTKLEKAVQDRARLVKVKYIDFIRDKADISHPFQAFEYKRKSFHHEQEVRALLESYPSQRIIEALPQNSIPTEGRELSSSDCTVDVILRNLIDNVVVSPYSSNWFFNVIRGLTEQYKLNQNLVIISELNADPVYANI